MRKRVTIFGGSFDPITDAHLKVAAEIVHSQMADEVWVIPCGPRPDKKLVADSLHRYIMCHLAVNSSFGSRFPIYVKDFELFEQQSMPTYFLIEKLEKEYLDYEFLIVLGSDLINNIKTWDQGEKLYKEKKFLVIPRPGYKKQKLPENFVWLEARDLELAHTQLSSTEIRRRLAKNASLVDGLIPSVVLAHIIRYNLYH